MDNNYTVFHCHSDYSLLDSTTKFKDYIDRAIELKQNAICITEHGNIYNWISKKIACDKAGIKYMHGIEIYLTEELEPKVRDNYHTILIAKNMDGLKEINSLISVANHEDHFYFKPRISFEEFLNISDNVIKISACLASPLNKYNGELTDKLLKHYNYYEVQPHINSEDQKEYNRKLYQLSLQYNKPLIAGTDTHSINQYKAECRTILQLAKGIEYGDEDMFDLTYKSYDELVDMFNKQDSLPKEVYLEAINNTNIMADSTEEIVLDTSFKYPKVSDDDIGTMKKELVKSLKDKINKGIIPKEQEIKFKENIREELRVFKKVGMCGFMLFMSNLIRWCRNNEIYPGVARGSCGGSCIAYVLDIIDINPIEWKTVFSRFCNEDRKEIGDIDVDFAPDDREKVYNHMIEEFGEQYTAYILAIGTVAEKGTIDEIGRALSRKFPTEKQYNLQSIAEIKQEYDNDPESTKIKYPNIFYYFDGIVNTSISQSMHPAGMVVSPITLSDNYGELQRDGKTLLQIDMEDVHEVSLVKYDILGLKNVGIIRDACRIANLDYPMSHNINWNDNNVWNDMLKSSIGLFQFEGEYAYSMIKKFKPDSIFGMSHITAALRPSGASYRDDLLEKKFHKNPSSIIDDMLKDNLGYLIYQEDTIKFLQNICGLTGSEADNVRRAIGRKQQDRLEASLPGILEGYCKMSSQPRDVAEEEAKEFLQIISDSSNFQFGYNHSIAYCMIGYLCAYLRYYYSIEFITSYLNNAKNQDDINDGIKLASIYNISIKQPKFGKSKAEYFMDKPNNLIYKGIASIKFLNEQVANDLYELAQNNNYNNFIDLYYDMYFNTSINSRQLEILIKSGYFSDFGNIGKLLEIVKECKSGKNRITKTLKEATLEKRIALLKEYEKNNNFIDIDFVDIIRFKIENDILSDDKDIHKNNREFVVIDILSKRNNNAVANIYQLSTGKIFKVKFKKLISQNKCLDTSDHIYVSNLKNENKWYIDENKEWKRYKDSDNQKENIVYSFSIINKYQGKENN